MSKHLNLESPDFRSGGVLPPEHTCDGVNVPPELNWSDPPEGTQSFVVVVDDPDAPRRFFTHWLVYDIAADARGLDPDDLEGCVQGLNDYGKAGWGGACPPQQHPAHRYRFLVYALDKRVELPPGADRATVDEAMRDHVLARGELSAQYRRRQPERHPQGPQA